MFQWQFGMRSGIQATLRGMLVGILACGLFGCGPRRPQTYPVHGKVTFPDGEPVTSAIIEFELISGDLKQAYNARGMVGRDGTFQLKTFRDGDGAVAGRHRAIVQEPLPIDDPEPGKKPWVAAIHPKYRTYENSGLEFEVKETSNEIPIVVDRIGKSAPK